MAEYINKDEFTAWVKEHWCADCQNDNGLRCRACWIDDAIDIVEEAPPADVVPKSEVDRLTVELEAMRTAANSYKMHYEDLASEIFTEIERLIELYAVNTPNHMPFNYIDIQFVHWVSELKKKYVEDNK